MANYTLPTTTRISRINRTLQSSTFLQASPFSGSIQSQDWGGSWWEYDIDLDVTQDTEGKSLSAFLNRLRGSANTFTFQDPSINNKFQPGTIRVKGGSQTGDTLVTDGWLPTEGNLLLSSNDYLSGDWAVVGNSTVTASGSHHILADDNSGGTGFPQVSQAVPLPKEGYYTFFVDALPSLSKYLALRSSNYDSNTDGISFFDLGAKVVTNADPNHTAFVVHPIDDVHSRIRCAITFYAYPSDLNGNVRIQLSDDGQSTNTTLDGTNSVTLYESFLIPGTSAYEGVFIPDTPSSNEQATVLDAGDFISIGSGADTRLYQLVEVATASSDVRESTIRFVPPLRSSPADNTLVEVQNPVVALRPISTVPNQVTQPINYRFTLQSRENI